MLPTQNTLQDCTYAEFLNNTSALAHYKARVELRRFRLPSVLYAKLAVSSRKLDTCKNLPLSRLV